MSAASDVEVIPQERTLSVLYALVWGTEARPMQHTLEFLGTWELDCVANSVNILTNPDGGLKLFLALVRDILSAVGRDVIFCVDADGKVCARNLKVLPDLPATIVEAESGSNHLNLPNPFKLKMKSSEHLPSHESRINLKYLLDEPQELGQLSLGSPLCGFVLCPGGDDLFGVIWTEMDLTVCIYTSDVAASDRIRR